MLFNGKDLTKRLSEDDCAWLITHNFINWKKYIINQNYRLELNIVQPLPLISIAPVEAKPFDFEDLRKKYAPKEEEAKVIAETRSKLSLWFP